MPKKFKLYRRDYGKFNKAEFLSEIQSINWNDDENTDINSKFTLFYSKLSLVVDKHIPLKPLSKKSIKALSKPWITPGIRKSIKMKNNLYKKFIQTKSSYYHEKFKYYRNMIKKLTTKSKTNYYNKYFRANQTNTKNIWKGIRSIISLKPLSNNIPSKILVNGSELADCNSIANAFNKHFINISQKLTSSIPEANKSAMSFMSSRLLDSFHIDHVSTIEIEEEIDRLNPSKAVGPYSIPVFALKLIPEAISKPLKSIFNLSLSCGIVPDKLKMASVIPIFKKGSKLNLDNYRPISLLSIFNRILEKLMYKRLISFINKHNLIYEKQLGFRRQHSAEMAILLITDKIQKTIDSGMYASGVFLDLSKAFDTVNHEILLQKLEFYGIRGIAKKWFESYLSNRRQNVIIGNTKSDYYLWSTPGSILGPLLFLLYINDFSNSSQTLDFHIFADDSNLFYANKSLIELEKVVNNELISIHSWLCANKLVLNIDKSNIVVFHPPQKKLQYQINIIINGENLSIAPSTKYLGVIIDSHLNWKDQISYLTNKIKRNIGALSKLRHFTNSEILNNIYYSLVYPFFTYGVIAWGNTYSTTIKPLFILQKKAIRIITHSKYDDHTDPLFNKLSILKLEDLIYYYNAMFMHDYHNSKLPKLFDSFFIQISQIHKYNTRLASKSSISLPYARTNYGKFNIRFNGAKVWNSIDEELKNLSKTLFKKKLKDALLRHYNDDMAI